MAKSKTKGVRFTKTRVIIFLVIAVILGVSMLFSAQIDNLYQQMVGNTNVATSDEILANSKLSINYVNVGQGDCIMVNLPDDKNMIIDAGQTQGDDETTTEHVIEYAKANVIQDGQKFDYMVLTHAHLDHVSMLDNVLEEFDVGIVVRPPEFYQSDTDEELTNKETELANKVGATIKSSYNTTKTATMRRFLNDAYNEPNCEMLVTNDEIVWEGQDDEGNTYTIKFYTIDMEKYYNPPSESAFTNENNYSPLIVLTYKGHSIAFTGDGEKESEQALIEKYGSALPNVDFMDLAHHGSRTGNIAEFIEALDPEYAIVSVGKNNSYGLPDEEVYEILKNYDPEFANRIFSTADYGDIVIGFNYIAPTTGEDLDDSTKTASTSNNTLVTNGDVAVGISSGEYSSQTVIKWWYIALGLIVLSAILIFLTPSKQKKLIKKLNKK